MQFNYRQLYENLGYLFYSIAAADKVVAQAEENTLKQTIDNIWLPVENSTDEFGTDASEYIYISFDYLHAEGVDAEFAFDKFKDYFETHSNGIDPSIRKKITLTAEAIADAYHGKNQQEQQMLTRLRKLLKS